MGGGDNVDYSGTANQREECYTQLKLGSPNLSKEIMSYIIEMNGCEMDAELY